MDSPPLLPVDEVLACEGTSQPSEVIGTSREGRDVVAHRLGDGPLRLSLIAGCHADEPVGPAMLDRLVAWLGHPRRGAAARRAATWSVVPHVNPDGEARNRRWTDHPVTLDSGGRGYDLAAYLRHAIRERPGDDVEFGFPRGTVADAGARPENRAVAAFLDAGAPFHLHGSFHGMAFAAGPWFLLEAAWAEIGNDRTATLRDRVRAAVRDLGYRPHDIDRGGEKGFHRIDAGFTTRPDSRAMAAHFRAAGDDEMAARFRPSSMEHVRGLGGDPLTLVSEMPLFLLPADAYRGDLVRPAAIDRLAAAAAAGGGRLVRAAAEEAVRPMPIEDQMRLQLAYLDAAIEAVLAWAGGKPT